MIFPGHIAGGYLAAKAVLAVAASHGVTFTPEQVTALLTISTIAGERPDIDILFFFLHHKYSRGSEKRENHRTFITHVPVFWLAIALLIIGGGWIGDSQFTELFGLLILAGTWTHFFLDSFEYGIRWLWPFSDRRFAMRQIIEPDISAPQGTVAHYRELISKVWNKRLTYVLEVIVVVGAIVVAIYS